MKRIHSPSPCTLVLITHFKFLQKMVLQSIKFNSESGELLVIDQLLLPEKTHYLKIKGVEDGWKTINKMQVNFDMLRM